MSTEGTVRFGILGAGRVAHDFATGLRVVDGAALVAVASRAVATAERFAVTFPSARVHESYEELIADPIVDVVYVATPHHLHAPQSLLSLEAGKAVLCEKPFAMDASESRAVVDMARRQQRFCMEAMWMRFFPIVQCAAEIVASGDIGEPRLLFADFGVPTAGGPGSRFFDAAQGGGALLDRGVYAVSLATMIFGRPVEVVAQSGVATTGVDEHTGIVMRFDGGRLAVLAASLTSLTSNAATVTGTLGSVTIEAPFYCPSRLVVRHHRPATVAELPSRRDELVAMAKRTRVGRTMLRVARPLVVGRPSRVTAPIAGNGYGYEAAEVVRCLRAGELESPRMPLDESVAIMQILDEIRTSTSG